jgi:5,10-methylenetetrahydrofolate reductase
MYKKIEAHASALVTQPVYDIQHAKILIDLFEDVKANFTDERKNASLIFGLFPVIKTSTALFLHNKVPGLHIPESYITNLQKAKDISLDEEYKVGFNLCHNLMQEIYKLNPRIHLMTANNFQLASKLLNSINR